MKVDPDVLLPFGIGVLMGHYITLGFLLWMRSR